MNSQKITFNMCLLSVNIYCTAYASLFASDALLVATVNLQRIGGTFHLLNNLDSFPRCVCHCVTGGIHDMKGMIYTVFRKEHPLLSSWITLRKSNQFE